MGGFFKSPTIGLWAFSQDILCLFCYNCSNESKEVDAMNEYNFNVLTWGEFEEFTKDLLSEEMGVNFQAFADGADGGVDLR